MEPSASRCAHVCTCDSLRACVRARGPGKARTFQPPVQSCFQPETAQARTHPRPPMFPSAPFQEELAHGGNAGLINPIGWLEPIHKKYPGEIWEMIPNPHHQPSWQASDRTAPTASSDPSPHTPARSHHHLHYHHACQVSRMLTCTRTPARCPSRPWEAPSSPGVTGASTRWIPARSRPTAACPR